MKTLQEVVEQFFGENRTIYPIISDAHRRNTSGKYYIARQFDNDICKIFAGDEDDEICIVATRSAEKLEAVLIALVY